MRKFLLLILGILLSLTTYAQDITGNYQRIDKIPDTEESTIMEFQGNGLFKETTLGHLENSTIRKGNFQVEGDTLILNFKNLEQRNFVINRKNKIVRDDSLQKLQTDLFVKIHYKDEKENPNAIVHFNNKNKEIVLATFIESSNAFSLFNETIQFLKFSSLGKHDIEVDLKPLLGYNSTIDIYFTKVRMENAQPATQKFLIENSENGNLKLISLNDKKIWVLEKV
ncbi:hypothetical protein E0K83_07050 [Gramella sp. BOM4]|nr:hypothetical protein [Christiangramia bathymodioli]